MPTESSAKVPYVSYGTFKSAVETLSQSVVPTSAIDRHVLDNLSGADYGALVSGLKFLGLMDGDRKATAEYRALVESFREGQDQYKASLIKILNTAYKTITGSVDIEQGTIAELEAAFREAGVPQGQMLAKTVRFYVRALTDCGVAVSPHITKPKKRNVSPKSNGTTPKRKLKPQPAPDTSVPPDRPHDGGADQPPKGFQRVQVPMVPGGHIQFPTSLTDAQCGIYESVVVTLRTAVKANKEETL